VDVRGYLATERSGVWWRRAFSPRARVRHAHGKFQSGEDLTRQVEPYTEAQFLEHTRTLEPATESPPDDATTALEGLERAEAELVAYRDANLVSIIGKDAYRDGLAERQRHVDEARTGYAEARSLANAAIETADIPGTWPDLSTAERAALLRTIIDSAYVKRANRPGKGSRVADRVRIVWALDDDRRPYKYIPAESSTNAERVALPGRPRIEGLAVVAL
jgi:hypothetical protein